MTLRKEYLKEQFYDICSKMIHLLDYTIVNLKNFFDLSININIFQILLE